MPGQLRLSLSACLVLIAVHFSINSLIIKKVQIEHQLQATFKSTCFTFASQHSFINRINETSLNTIEMKFVVILLLCLSVGALSKSTEEESLSSESGSYISSSSAEESKQSSSNEERPQDRVARAVFFRPSLAKESEQSFSDEERPQDRVARAVFSRPSLAKVSTRSAESNDIEQFGSGSKEQSGSDSNGNQNSLLNIPSELLDSVNGILKSYGITSPNDLKNFISKLISGKMPLNKVFDVLSPGQIQELLNNINPLFDIVKNIPLISSIYGTLAQIISIPISVITSIFALIIAAAGRILSSIR